MSDKLLPDHVFYLDDWIWEAEMRAHYAPALKGKEKVNLQTSNLCKATSEVESWNHPVPIYIKKVDEAIKPRNFLWNSYIYCAWATKDEKEIGNSGFSQ